MRARTRIPLLVLIAVMVGAAIPQAPNASHGERDLGPVPGDDTTFVIGEGGEGLGYSGHMATSSDVLDMMDRCGVHDPSRDYNVLFDGHGTGLAPPTHDEYADMVGTARIVDDVRLAPGGELPSAVDHSTEKCFPVVDSQGGQGSCGAWACSYYTNGYLQGRDHGWTGSHNGSNKSQLMSPAWVYNKINYGYDSGSNWYRNHALMSSVGNADWESMPYNWRDLYGWGDEDAWRVAPRYRVRPTYDLASTSSTMVIKAWLAEGYVLPMAFDAGQYSKLSDDDIISAVEYSSNRANHANTIVGYNDSVTADGEAGAFKIVNSWGRSWSGDGYWWMTYDCLKELYWPVMRMYDYVDYEPRLLGTLDQSTAASKDSRIRMGTTSGRYAERVPHWWAGTRPYPKFMALDITELVEDVGLAGFYLYYGSGATRGTLSSFEVELYEDGYTEGSPDRVARSDGVPRQAACTVSTGWKGVHIRHANPANDTWHRAVVEVNGTATGRVPRQVHHEDFEGRWLKEWTTQDLVTWGGLDTWGTSDHRQNAGDRSAYCAGSDAGMAFFEDFDDNGLMPAEWSTTSSGLFQYPFKVVNSGYQGCGGSDYLVASRSDRGAGFNVTELLYTSSPPNATSWKDLQLRFYIEYDHNDGDEHVKVLYSNASTYPNWTVADTLTADALGYRSYDLSSQDGESRVYLGFEYHGTEDMYVTIDDVLLAGKKVRYDRDMRADMYLATGDLTGYDNVTLDYQYWIDSEAGVDLLQAVYRTSTSSPWASLANHSGAGKAWTAATVDVPSNASHVGFRFTSDGANVSEGAYVDDVTLTGYQAISSVELGVDGGAWQNGTAGANWSCAWNTTDLPDGRHDLVVRVNYSGAYDRTSLFLNSDNTPPNVTQVWNDTVSTGDDTALHVSADDPNGVAWVQALYLFDDGTEAVENATSTDNLTWHLPLAVPTDGVDMRYRFRLMDGIGNELVTDPVDIRVIDNDAPSIGADSTPEVATTGDPLTFAVKGADNIRVASIDLEYWYDGLPSVNVTRSGDRFSHTIAVDHTLDPVYYRLSVTDTSGNTIASEAREVPVLDNDLPVFGADGTPSEADAGGNVTLSVSVGDNIGVAGMWVVHRFGDGEAVNGTPARDAGGNWTLTVDVPWDSLDALSYVFFAVDTSGNLNSTREATVTVMDRFLPWFGDDLTPGTATTGDPLTFAVDLFDNIRVDRAWVEHWYGEEGPHRTADLALDEGARWTASVTARDTILPLNYVLHVEDLSGNRNATLQAHIDMVDDDPPVVRDDASPGETTTGVEYAFVCIIGDNLGVASVDVSWWFAGGQADLAPMEGRDLDGNANGTYTLVITVPSNSTAALNYVITARDGSGNQVATVEKTVAVLDVTPPTADAGEGTTVDQHQEVAFDGSGSWDNVAVAAWNWTVKWAGAVVGRLEGPTPSMVLHEAGLYTVTLRVVDPSGNADTAVIEATVRDTTPPVPDCGEDKVVDQNTTVFLDGSGSWDNVGITAWTWSFVYDGSPRELSGQDNRFGFFVPGEYTVTLRVVDLAGNANSTSIVITVRDTVDPRPVTQGDLEGRVDERVTFYSAGSWDNVGIVNWTWTVELASGRTVCLYGPEAELDIDEPGDHRVTLTVRDADGNTVVSEPFTVHVPNIRFWLTLLFIAVGGVVATTAVALHTRRKSRRLDEQRAGRG